ncbi:MULTISPECIES: (Z)-2-((N-methylformamido)methylene)-5-hydroxybutyrolactone dehydrogenase [unclassified Acinetobacter]|uniref:(Z)-2-((N-methylformamido)methylene)-5- hydroxybutyrolactone dehydrogenase n=1 Tax=unclassified Acinetobacter TaxID=196816 RepID=UPI002446C810|nr:MULTISPECIES: (Z)-2-((N-methylformamido)methylene)-5-hydroxybutyrolactone dehydrogenase [unclassified Acinetobacter]MDH0032939.1 aldehyde dehydrogenase [Acinetobacter sp. GD04021]MDH0887507.1 aldehyde dehydrogenase [Acinetobacter sp. GD03873]MDH1084730.1 aldehyde dehydrogenase [Acinetobacter sp. GD03983]MDH2190879.1 aldehyde dehydrogenase [Acinetobacter sp. GD03645]MDH2205057.1 aldehyde dehydrogenase [Acinetobacter sp. GD03647]
MTSQFQLYINGQFEDGAAQFDSINPATGQVWAKMPEARSDEVNRAVAAASQALQDSAWADLTASQRGKLLYKLADLIEKSAPQLAQYETSDTGKIIRETSSQIAYVAEYYRYYAGIADKLEGSYLPIDKQDMQAWTIREPVGVVAAIVPWNSQLFLSAVKVGPALAAGCTVVLKASEEGPAPLLAFARLVHEAGFPAGVVNVITGFGPECGAVLSSHPDVAHVAFTGGPETARHIVRNSAENLAKVSLELGGKSPFIVFADADLQSAVNAQVAAIFAATGQSCVAGSRLLVEESIKDEFVQRLVERVQSIKIGLPDDMATEYGPLCTLRQRHKIEQVVASSIQQGAKLLTGGKSLDREGYYYPPTILDCSDVPQADCVMTELFGPVLSVVSFSTEAEAIHKANNTPYGLAAGVFTNHLSRAHRMTKALQSGIVWLNTYRAVSPLAPFGGHGLSGHGREGGSDAVLDYTTTKTVWLRTSDQPIDDPFVMR